MWAAKSNGHKACEFGGSADAWHPRSWLLARHGVEQDLTRSVVTLPPVSEQSNTQQLLLNVFDQPAVGATSKV